MSLAHTHTQSSEPRPIVLSDIIEKADYHLLDSYALKDEMMAKIETVFLDGIEKFHTKAAREAIASEGLRSLHKHFPVEKVRLLEHYVHETLRDDLYYWSYRVGRENVGIDHEFFVDHLIVIRIHYPHLDARRARAEDIEAPPYPLTERMRLGMAALRNPKMLFYAGQRALEKRRAAALKKKNADHAYDAKAYHGNIATPARAHGAHVDTWYGHSYDGINLWLSIDGVNEDNTIILYPEMWEQEVHFDPVSMYLATGQATPKPLKYAMPPGRLLVFNPEMLHGTQVNISDETRVALTTRLNPHAPRFAKEAPFHFEYWYSSEDLAKRRFNKMSVFPHKEYQGEPSWTKREPLVHEKTNRISLETPLEKEAPLDLGASDLLPAGVKLSVDLPNAQVLLWRAADGIRAYSRRCPHMGIDLVDGYHDDKEVYCPGHGMSFSLDDGASSCAAFRLRQYRAWEEDGRLMMQRMAGAED